MHPIVGCWVFFVFWVFFLFLFLCFFVFFCFFFVLFCFSFVFFCLFFVCLFCFCFCLFFFFFAFWGCYCCFFLFCFCFFVLVLFIFLLSFILFLVLWGVCCCCCFFVCFFFGWGLSIFILHPSSPNTPLKKMMLGWNKWCMKFKFRFNPAVVRRVKIWDILVMKYGLWREILPLCTQKTQIYKWYVTLPISAFITVT